MTLLELIRENVMFDSNKHDLGWVFEDKVNEMSNMELLEKISDQLGDLL